MKKTVLMLAVGGLMLATPSCKKGENDPFLSLSSRKARVAGEWGVSGYESTTVVSDPDGDKMTTTESMSGSTITTTWTDYDAGSGTTTTTTASTTVNEGSYTFEKDGTWSHVWNTTTVDVDTYDFGGVTYTITTTTVEHYSASGNWSFVGKVKDEYKNKERIVMNTLSTSWDSQSTTVTAGGGSSTTSHGDLDASTNTYHSGQVETIYEIDQLKGKEMILKMIGETSGTNSTTPYGGSTTTTQDDNVTMETTMTLTAK